MTEAEEYLQQRMLEHEYITAYLEARDEMRRSATEDR